MREAVIVASSPHAAGQVRIGDRSTSPGRTIWPRMRSATCCGKAPGLDPAEIEEVILGCGQPHGAAGPQHRARGARCAPGCRSRRPASPSTASAIRACRPSCRPRTWSLHEGVDAAIGGGVESITMMQRDKSPNPWVQEHVPGLYMAMGETAEVVAKRYGVTPRRRRTSTRWSASSGSRARSRTGSSRTRSRRCRCARAILDKKTGEKIGEEDALVDRDECNRADTTLEGLREAAAGVRHDERQGQRHGRQLVAAVGRRVGHARDVERSREGARASRRCSSSAATPSPAASRTRWASARCSPCRSC